MPEASLGRVLSRCAASSASDCAFCAGQASWELRMCRCTGTAANADVLAHDSRPAGLLDCPASRA